MEREERNRIVSLVLIVLVVFIILEVFSSLRPIYPMNMFFQTSPGYIIMLIFGALFWILIITALILLILWLVRQLNDKEKMEHLRKHVKRGLKRIEEEI